MADVVVTLRISLRPDVVREKQKQHRRQYVHGEVHERSHNYDGYIRRFWRDLSPLIMNPQNGCVYRDFRVESVCLCSIHVHLCAIHAQYL